MRKSVEFSELAGRIITEVSRRKDIETYFPALYTGANEGLVFDVEGGDRYVLVHEQDCCESVEINDIEGDLQSLVGNPVLIAEEVSSTADTDDGDETWTFYKLATIKGHVDIRFHGESNGYYSTSVTCFKISAEGQN